MGEHVPHNTTSGVREPFVSSAEFYDAIYAARGKDYPAEAAYLNRVAERVLGRPPRTLLDVACGTGEHLRHFRRSCDVAGIDLSLAMIEIARRKLPDVELNEADMCQFVLGRTFDVITCLFASIAYLPDEIALRNAISRMVAHFAPGGVLLLEPGVLRGDVEPPRVDDMELQVGRGRLRRRTSARLEDEFLIVEFDHEWCEAGAVTTFREEHVIRLFSRQAYEQALGDAGLTSSFEAKGPAGRGLFIAHAPP